MELTNKKKWKHFLSSIENVPKNHSTQIRITTKSKTKCLAGEFANKLLKDADGTVTLVGKEHVLNRYKYLDVSKNQTQTPITNIKFPLVKAQTWPKLKNETIGELTRTRACRQLLPATSDSTKIQNVDAIIPEVLQNNTNEHVKEMSPQSADTIFPEVPQNDTNEHVKETSAQSADAINPEVPQTDTNEHVKETFDQSADDITPEVPHTDTNEHVKETSAQNAEAIIPEVPQTDTNEHVKETSSQSANAIIPDVSHTDTNEHVKETSVQNADAIMPEVPQIDTNENVKESSVQNADDIIPVVSQTDTNEHVKETSVQNADAIMPEVPQIETNEYVSEASAQSADDINLTQMSIKVSVTDIPLVLDDIDIHRIRDTEKDIDKSCSGWDVSSIAKYFNFKDCVIDITMPTELPPCKDDIIKKVQTDIDLRLKTGTSDSTFVMKLKSITITEAGSRLVLDPILVSLCSELGLQFEVEKNINCSFLPNCKFDYCIRKGEHIIGCIEAKSVTGLSSKSVAQAVIELMILQTTLIATEKPKVDISKFPVFAIVTDGHRFIYIQLKGSSLGFEYDNDKLKIRKVTKEDDWKDILQLITCIVEGDKKRE